MPKDSRINGYIISYYERMRASAHTEFNRSMEFLKVFALPPVKPRDLDLSSSSGQAQDERDFISSPGLIYSQQVLMQDGAKI